MTPLPWQRGQVTILLIVLPPSYLMTLASLMTTVTKTPTTKATIMALAHIETNKSKLTTPMMTKAVTAITAMRVIECRIFVPIILLLPGKRMGWVFLLTLTHHFLIVHRFINFAASL